MALYCDLRQNTWHEHFSLSKEKLYGIINFCERCEVQVDFISAVETLKEMGFLNNENYKTLLARVGGLTGKPNKRILQFTLDVLQDISFQRYIEFLFAFDRKLAISLVDWTSNRLLQTPQLQRERLPNHKTRVELFIKLKTDIDCGITRDVKEILSEKADSELININQSTDSMGKQLATDLYVVYTFTLVQHYKENDQKQLILQNMIESIPRDINPKFAEGIFNSKMARLTGDDIYIRRALAICQNCDDLLLWAVVSIDIIHIFREKISGESEETCIEDIIKYCTQGLIGAYRNDFLQRMIYMNLALYFVGISDQLKAGLNTISDNNRVQAKSLLTYIKDHLFRDIEPRRKLMYCYAMAHLHKLSGNIEFARKYAMEAKTLVGKYSFFPDEKVIVGEYFESLQLEGLQLPEPAGFPLFHTPS